jgi:hypothetical protein
MPFGASASLSLAVELSKGQRMERLLVAAWLALLVATNLAPLPGGAEAQPLMSDGTVVVLPGADNLGATADHYLRNLVIRLFGTAVSIGGLAGMQKNPGPGAIGLASGVGILFIPNLMGSGADAAAGATSLAVLTQTPLAVWAQWGYGVVGEAALVMAGLVSWRWTRRTA